MKATARSLAILAILSPLAMAQSKGGDIHAVDFRNGFTYDVGFGDEPRPVTVKNGEYSHAADDEKVYFEVRKVVYGDLTGDGKDEAIVETLLNTGGTGQFTDGLVFEFRGGKAVLVGSLGTGDRADGGVFDVFIRDGKIYDERFGQEHSGACCPEYVETHVAVLRAGKLQEIGKPSRRAYYNYAFDESPAPHRIKFLPGTSSVSLAGSSTNDESYLFGAKAGQTVAVSIAGGDAKAEAVVATKSGEIGRASVDRAWVGKLPVSGDFTVTIRSAAAKESESAYYTMTVAIR